MWWKSKPNLNHSSPQWRYSIQIKFQKMICSHWKILYFVEEKCMMTLVVPVQVYTSNGRQIPYLLRKGPWLDIGKKKILKIEHCVFLGPGWNTEKQCYISYVCLLVNYCCFTSDAHLDKCWQKQDKWGGKILRNRDKFSQKDLSSLFVFLITFIQFGVTFNGQHL